MNEKILEQVEKIESIICHAPYTPEATKALKASEISEFLNRLDHSLDKIQGRLEDIREILANEQG